MSDGSTALLEQEIRSWRLPPLRSKNAKRHAKPCKLTDSDGLFLYMTPDGRRDRRMNYRHPGQQKWLASRVQGI
ncbi:Arm DNA-binding domain-containing protein [Sphingobium terrigena]|uniref:Arm DNA-binding domain-containing protein n=1 Tax=Sphingobium terrigena TaxID=2304063 RepID=UPI001EF071D0|nr:Arm DNA-binding domain-containing protein [Sphingobium terrigena]